MKFLNEDIEITLTDIDVPNDGTYTYKIEVNQKYIFIGNVFLEKSDTKKTFYLNDILKNYQFNGNVVDGYNYNVVREVEVILYIENEEYRGSETVAFLHQYPNFNSTINTPIPDILWMPLLQGADYNNCGELKLVPTYPFVDTIKLPFTYLGIYGEAPQNQTLLAYDSVTRQRSTDDYAFYIGEDIRGGAFGLGNYYLSDILSGNRMTGITYRNMSLKENKNFASVVFADESYWKCTSSTFTSPLYKVVIVLSRGDSVTRSQTFNYDDSETFSMDVSDYSNKGWTTLSIYVFDTSEKLSKTPRRYVTFDVTKLFNKSNRYFVPLIFDFSFAGNVLKITHLQFDLDVYDAEPDSLIICSNDEDTIIAKFDYCSRYFLRWMDRYGMPQVQPFNGTNIFSETFENNETINYKNQRKKSNILVQPKWRLNSKWLNSDLYPFYESIFVSPYLQLYDAKEDKIYNVLVSNTDYTEKTFKNQGNQMFNLQLEVELDKKQDIIY